MIKVQSNRSVHDIIALVASNTGLSDVVEPVMLLRSSLRISGPRSDARRCFFSSPPQKFTVHRILPHAQTDLFKLVSDIGSYSQFVPFCSGSKVTKHDHDLPVQADLTVGFKAYEETFSSQVRCTPPEKVEAVASDNPLFEKLATTWRLQQLSGSSESCRVHLDIEYKFANPLYAALSNSVLPRVADEIIEAFQKQAKEQLAHKKNTQEKETPQITMKHG